MELEILFLLLAGHYLGDFSLQTAHMAKFKNPNNQPNLEDIPEGQKLQLLWPHVLTAHAMIHGLIVALVTSSFRLGVSEFVLHWMIDYNKCQNRFGIHLDQSLHIICKIAWWMLAI